jgi:beta-1,4-galactosyltransferase 4
MNFKMEKQKEKLAILVPYRDREEHLNIFTPYISNFLKNFPEIEYEIFIIEQYGDKLFNRGKLLNVGAKIAENFEYFVLHDIDMLPINCNYYFIPLMDKSTIHLARHRYIQQKGSKKEMNCGGGYGGGVLKISKNLFFHLNGFRNDYWGWGGEDDELRIRMNKCDIRLLCIKDNNDELGEFVLLNHNKNYNSINFDKNLKIWENTKKLADNKINNDPILDDGLNTLKYDLLKIENNEFYKKYIVNID